jgi:sugar phosphate isomerase/epimerase
VTEPQISVQLYSVHRQLADDLDGTLERLAAIGLKNVEAFDFVARADALAAAFRSYGLAAPTGHALLIGGAGDTPDGLLSAPGAEATFEAAAKLGIATVIDPYVDPARWRDPASVLRIAERLNELAAQAAPYGLTMGYHNHDAELRNEFDGVPALAFLAEHLEPGVVLEVDLYWAAAAGADPARLLPALGDRVKAVHIKDGPMRPGITTDPLPTDQAPAGTGDVPLAAALASTDSIEYAVIEFDHFDGDIFEGVTASYDFLVRQIG